MTETAKKKLSYIWDYYKMHILAGAVALLLILYFLSLFHNRGQAADLYVSFVNEYEDIEALRDDFISYEKMQKQTDLSDRELSFDAAHFFNLANEQDFTNSYFQKLIAKLENAQVDVIIAGRENILGIAQGGRVMDLEDARVKDILTKGAKLLYYEAENESIPVGIILPASTPLYGYEADEEVCLAFGSKLKNEKLALDFAEYLLS